MGDLPPELQPKILRALQEKEFERVGGTRTIPVNVRLVAATNRDLAKMVAGGQFRSDLYYRLRVFPLTLPPLRERREDIPLLVRYFLNSHSKRIGKRIETIPPETMQTLVKWRWPGNIRELENFMERSVILSSGSTLRSPLAELEADEEAAPSTNANLESAEREHVGTYACARRARVTRSQLSAEAALSHRAASQHRPASNRVVAPSGKRFSPLRGFRRHGRHSGDPVSESVVPIHALIHNHSSVGRFGFMAGTALRRFFVPACRRPVLVRWRFMTISFSKICKSISTGNCHYFLVGVLQA